MIYECFKQIDLQSVVFSTFFVKFVELLTIKYCFSAISLFEDN